MFAQNQMPPATTKWQALFGGMNLAQPTTPTPPMVPNPQMAPILNVDIDNGAMIALRIGGAVIGMAVGAAISYGICCLGMRNCGR